MKDVMMSRWRCHVSAFSFQPREKGLVRVHKVRTGWEKQILEPPLSILRWETIDGNISSVDQFETWIRESAGAVGR